MPVDFQDRRFVWCVGLFRRAYAKALKAINSISPLIGSSFDERIQFAVGRVTKGRRFPSSLGEEAEQGQGDDVAVGSDASQVQILPDPLH